MTSPSGSDGTEAGRPGFAAPGSTPPGSQPAVPRLDALRALRVEALDDGDEPWPDPPPATGGWSPPAPWIAGDPWGVPATAPAPTADAGPQGAVPWALGGTVATAPPPPPTPGVDDRSAPAPRGTLPAAAPPLWYPAQPPTAAYAPPVPPGRTPRPAPAAVAPPPPRSPWVVATAVLAVVVLALGVSLAIVSVDDGDDPTEIAAREPRELPPASGSEPGTAPPVTEAPPTTEDPPEAPVDDIIAVIDDIEAFVAAERGLPFLRDVVVELEDDAAFEARLFADFDEDAEDLRILGDAFGALGLLDPDVDVVGAYRELLGVGVVGFYDPDTEELVVRGTEASPYVRTVIAHELVHALDDQHFDLDRDFEDTADESSFGFLAVVEGDSVRIEDAYRDTFTAEEEQAAIAEELSIGVGFDPFAVPFVLLESLTAPYELGPVLVAAILDAGGDEALAAALTVPPTTSEQVLDPDVFVADEAGVAVPTPSADGPVVDDGAFGAFTLAQLLDEVGVDRSLADAAAEGWGGDAYVQWDEAAGTTCVRLAIVGDTPADTAELAEALEQAADRSPATARLEVAPGDGPVTYTSCA